jgi:hypothetical protein
MRDFIHDLTRRLEDVLDEGWQESSKREEFLKEVKRVIQELALKEYRGRLRIDDFQKFLNRVVDVVVKKF